jgi:hypothetical protein
VRRTYNHAEHFENRRVMMQQWADYLDATMAGNKVFADRFGKVAA